MGKEAVDNDWKYLHSDNSQYLEQIENYNPNYDNNIVSTHLKSLNCKSVNFKLGKEAKTLNEQVSYVNFFDYL